jgi:hypothetical protein
VIEKFTLKCRLKSLLTLLIIPCSDFMLVLCFHPRICKLEMEKAFWKAKIRKIPCIFPC